MPARATSIGTDPVKQFSVFAENRVGRLYDLTALLKSHNVHIMALTTLDTTDSTILRVIVDDPDKARELMVNNDFAYSECDVLAVLFEAKINIHYVYSFIKRPEGRSGLAMNIEDADVATQCLGNHGFKVL